MRALSECRRRDIRLQRAYGLTFDAVAAMSTQQKDGAACAKSVRPGTWTTIT